MQDHKRRLGFVGILVEDRRMAPRVNGLLADFAHLIRARVGVPDQESGAGVIGLIVEGGNDDIGALTGRLGSVPSVQVKSALTRSVAAKDAPGPGEWPAENRPAK